MIMVSPRLLFSCLCILIGYSLMVIFALSLRFPFDVPMEVYWLSFVFVSIPPLCDLAFWNDNPKLRLIYLLSFSLIIHLQYAVVDYSPLLSSQDAIADYRLTDTILANSKWYPTFRLPFSSAYSFYPITNLIYASTSMITGISLLLVIKYLFVIKGLVVAPLVHKWFESFFPQRVAYLATLVFLASPGAILFPHKESFGVVFFFLVLYSSVNFLKNRQYSLIGLLSIVTLVMTHHFTTYIFLGLLTSVYFSRNVVRRLKTIRVSTQFFMLCWVAFVAWIAFVAFAIFSVHQKLVYKVFFQVLFVGNLTVSELMPLYTQYERAVIYLGFAITLISVFFGFKNYLRRGKSRSSEFFVIALFFIPLLAVASILRFSPLEQNRLLSHRAYEFGYIAVGAFSALFFVSKFQSKKKSALNVILVCAIVLMLVIGPMAGAMHPRTNARLASVVSARGLSLTAWITEHEVDESVIGDKVVYVLVTGYGNTGVVVSPELFASDDFSFPPSASYIVTYDYMSDFYGLNATKFGNSPYLHNIYSNGLLNTYGVTNRTSP